MRTFTQLPLDLIHRILCFSPDFKTLSAAIRTSKQDVYSVFQSHPKAIVRSILDNHIGAVLPEASRVAKIRKWRMMMRDGPIPDLPTLQDVMQVKFNRQEAEELLRMASVVSELEKLFSSSFKFSSITHSELTEAEAERFHRAVYLFWATCEVNVHEPGEDSSDELRDRCQKFMLTISTDNLYEMKKAEQFLRVVVKAACIRTNVHLVAFPDLEIWVTNYTLVGPEVILRAYQTGSEDYRDQDMGDDEDDSVDWFNVTLNEILRKRSISSETWEKMIEKPLIDKTEDISCKRCNAREEENLYTATNQYLLSGRFNPNHLFAMMDGNLPRNQVERVAFMTLLEARDDQQNLTFDYVTFFQEISEIQLEDEEFLWDNGSAYCSLCCSVLLAPRMWRWWLSHKHKSGVAIMDDCWYGYDCRTQMHKIDHARRLNHLCVPTRGDGPAWPQKTTLGSQATNSPGPSDTNNA